MPPISLVDIARYFLLLGGTVFGGPLALVAHIRKELVDYRGWLTAEEYHEGLAMATALPGPIAYQLGIYVGWLRRGLIGGAVAAIAFLLPPFVICLVGAVLYNHFRTSWVITALFYGISPAVIAFIVKAGYQLGRATFDSILPWAIGTISALVMAIWRPDPTPLFLIAALSGIAARCASPITLRSIEWHLAAFFFKAACILFGSGLVIVPYMQRYVVDQFHWLDTKTFLDAVAVGMMTPGPVVITSTFVGYLVAGLSGAAAATAGMFTPSLLFIYLGAPLLRRFRHHATVQGAIHGISAAVVGVILGSSLGLAKTAVVDGLTCGIAAVTLGCSLRWRIPDIVLIMAAGAVGVGVRALHG